MAKRSQGLRRSLLDEMEHDESSRRHSENDDFGVPQRFDQVFGGADDGYGDDDEDDDLLLMGHHRYNHDHHAHYDGDESSSTGVYSPLPTQRHSISSNDMGDSTSTNNIMLAMDPLYEGNEEVVMETMADMGYEDPDALASSRRSEFSNNSTSIQQAEEQTEVSTRRSHIYRSSGASTNVSDLSSADKSLLTPRTNRNSLLLETKNELSNRRLVVGRGSHDSSLTADTAAKSGGNGSTAGGSMALFKTIRKRATFLHRSPTRETGGTTIHSVGSHITDAVSRLNSHSSNEFEHVAAAAAVVAASTQAPTKRGVQFSRGDYALVVLTLLGREDPDGGKGQCTVDPVNAHGYPHGQGKTEAQRHGPYLYVLCQVTQVHFDEDERYYTVRRCDNDKEQRGDQAFMEAIRDEDAVDVALRAAQRTEREPKRPGRDEHYRGRRQCSAWYRHWVEERLLTWYRQKRQSTKVTVKHMMDGDHGYSINLSFSSINLLVACSLIFLFLDVVTVTFLSSDWDKSAAVLGL